MPGFSILCVATWLAVCLGRSSGSTLFMFLRIWVLGEVNSSPYRHSQKTNKFAFTVVFVQSKEWSGRSLLTTRICSDGGRSYFVLDGAEYQERPVRRTAWFVPYPLHIKFVLRRRLNGVLMRWGSGYILKSQTKKRNIRFEQ